LRLIDVISAFFTLFADRTLAPFGMIIPQHARYIFALFLAAAD